jgi:sec-independent protein translocase protein TatC
MLFIYYLKEIQYRILYCSVSILFNFIIFIFFSKELLFILVKPLLNINEEILFYYFIFTNMSDVLLIYIKIALILAFFFTIPTFLIQIIIFLFRGLYRYEFFFIFVMFLLSVTFLYIILLVLYSYLIPLIWFFFINFELTSANSLFGVYYEAKINDYINFMFSIFFIFCFFLQFPTIMLFCIYFNFVRINFFILYRKYFIIIFLILGGLFSPPDIFSQLFLSISVLVLYEIIIFFNLFLQNYLK